ncbi:MAG: hypothetical protein GF355_17775 [Candidatus Eisenbacteria bacterium]|nr:hypothetical protein [Candidatus Eisenbacteria bacterium]
MNRRVSLLVLVLLVTCLVPSTLEAQAVSPQLDGFASFGASFGVMKWIFDVDVAEDASIRPMLKGVFRYRFSRDWVLVGESGFGWNSYPEPADAVTIVVPTTFGVLHRLRDQWGFAVYLGAGGGLYYWNHKVKSISFRDPWTDQKHKGFEPGLYVGLEGEQQLSDHLTLSMTLQNHYMFSTHKDDFPAAFGEDDDFVSLRLGVNYHWSPRRGIIWGTSEPQEPGAPTP